MPYLCFPAWEEEQRVRNKRRKFPLRRTRRGTKKSRPRRKIPCPRRTAASFCGGKTLDRELLSIDRGLSA